jgi:hypothetical protein
MKPFNQSIMHLEYEFLYRVTLKPPVELAAGYYGKRMNKVRRNLDARRESHCGDAQPKQLAAE